jgi:hypothetical protein
MPGTVQIKKGSEINAPSGGQTEGMIRMNAITDMSDQVCGTGKWKQPKPTATLTISDDRKTSYCICCAPSWRRGCASQHFITFHSISTSSLSHHVHHSDYVFQTLLSTLLVALAQSSTDQTAPRDTSWLLAILLSFLPTPSTRRSTIATKI